MTTTHHYDNHTRYDNYTVIPSNYAVISSNYTVIPSEVEESLE